MTLFNDLLPLRRIDAADDENFHFFCLDFWRFCVIFTA